jgi:hypothetical protein
MCNMLNAYVHSNTDYCIDIWSVQSDARLYIIQNKIERFLIISSLQLLRKVHARDCIIQLGIILTLMSYATYVIS